jgi:hypothetical protein
LQPGNYVRHNFADGYDLDSRPNAQQTAGVKSFQVLLGKAFKALTPGRQLVLHGAGVIRRLRPCDSTTMLQESRTV